MSAIRTARARAHPNIALAKYWGKRAVGHNLPAVPSLSVTLAGMATVTRVTFDDALEDDVLVLNGAPAAAGPTARVRDLLERVRGRAGLTARARVESANDFPTASGLASSASAFAALALAAGAASGLGLDAEGTSDLARQASVSAARSVLGGFATLGTEPDAHGVLGARPLAPADHWDLRLVVAVTRETPKDVSSTLGMQHTAATSPFFPAWVADAPRVFAEIREAVSTRDLERLGPWAEASALRMHAAALAADPAVVYFLPGTLEALAAVRALRARHVPAYATIDAGPHVKVLTLPEHESEVERTLAATPGVLRTIRARPGEGATLLPDGASA